LINESKNDSNNVNSTSQTFTVCPLCKSDNAIITDPKSGEVICTKCGMVVSDRIQETREASHRLSTAEAKERERTGMPPSLAHSYMGLSTTPLCGKTDKDASGYKIEPSMLSTIRRLRTWDFRTQVRTSADRNLRLAFTELDTLKDKLGLSEPIIERTAYRKAQGKGMLRGRSILAVLAAAIYIACRELDAPRTLDDIATISNIKRKSIAKYERELIFQLSIKLPIIDTTKCIARVANKVSISEKTKHQAIHLMNNVVKNSIAAGKDPIGLAATVLYVSCIKTGDHKTKVELASAAQTTEMTIRKTFKDIKNRLELDD